MGYFKLILAGALIGVSLQAEIPTQVPSKVRKKYAYLYSLSPKAEADGSVSFHQARKFERGGVNVLFLKGDRFEMAFQHGKLLKAQIKDGALPQAAKMFEKTVSNGVPHIPFLNGAIMNHFKKKYPEAMLNSMLNRPGVSADEILLEAYGLSDGAGRPLSELLNGVVGPESLQVLVGERLEKSSFLGAVAAPSPQCSAFVAWGDSTANGEMLIGRNTDYPLNGYYDRFPTAIYYEPTDGAQKMLAITSAGLHTGGVVALNESGLYLGVHTVPSTNVSTSGMPAFMTAQEVLRQAHTFDEAVQLFSKVKTAAGWTYMLVSTKEKKAASIELSNGGMTLLPAQGTYHVQTNHFRTPERTPEYLHINVSVDDDTIGRFRRIEGMLQDSAGRLTDQDAMGILADKFDPIYGKVRGVGNVVAVHTTMTSVVVKPDSGSILVASGQAPVSISGYVELPLIERADAAAFGGYPTVTYANLNYGKLFPSEMQAEQYFIQGKIAFESALDTKKALGFLQKAIATDPANPAYRFVAAMLALKSKANGTAAQLLKELVTSPHDHYRRLAHYYLGRIDADAGFESAAIEHFRICLDGIDTKYEKKLVTAARDAIQRTNRIGRYRINAGMMALMIQEADMVEY